MDRTVSILLLLVVLLIGLAIGQATAQPITITAPAAVAAAASDKLTSFQRGQLITQCYQATSGDTITAYELSVKPCLNEVKKMP